MQVGSFDGVGKRGGGAEASQTPAAAPSPPPTNRGDGKYQTLRQGVDSLYLSFPGKLYQEWAEQLTRAKTFAQSEQDAKQALAHVFLLDHDFAVASRGGRLFPFVLQDSDYRIELASSKAKHVPLAYCQIRSALITAVGLPQAISQLKLLVSTFGEVSGPPTVSRVDVFVDFLSGYALDSWSKGAWVTRGRDVEQYWDGGPCSGWSIGKSGLLSARLYDKTLEIKKSRKDYLKPLWHQAGWNPPASVYRLEFQYRLEVLKQLGLGSLEAILDRLGSLWAYSTSEWLRLTTPLPGDSNKSRWVNHPLWDHLATVSWQPGPLRPLDRVVRPPAAPTDERLFNYYLGALTSYMAKRGLSDVLEAGWQFFDESRSHFDNSHFLTGKSFDQLSSERAAKKATQWHLEYPGIKEAVQALEAAERAKQYKKASGK